MKAVDAETMRALDRRAIEEARIPSLELMERAGAEVAFECRLFASSLPERHARRFLILAGKGNNGGDAFVAARLLREMKPGMEIALRCACPPEALAGNAKAMFERLPESLKDSLRFELAPEDLREGAIVVDGLLGTGFNGVLKEPFKSWIERVNASGLPVVAIDIPSGMDAGSGEAPGPALKADLTVSMALPKKGLLTQAGAKLSGRLKIADIGIPERFVLEAPSGLDAVTACDVRRLLGREPFDSHKGERGHVLAIGGSRLYPGAPALSALAALKAGAGLLTLAVPAGAEPHGALPNAVILRKVPNNSSCCFNETSLPTLKELMAKADAVALGPGLSQDQGCQCVVKALAESGRPAVFDADALNLAAARPELLEGASAHSVLTPHPGEMARLAKGFGLSASARSREEMALALAKKTGAAVVLKGARSVVAASDGRLAINCGGCPALATAGSGDCLTGVVAALLARGLEAFEAAKAGAFIHGLAGELARPCGSRGLLADELPDFIAQALKEISALA